MLYLALINGVVCYVVWFAVPQSAGATLGALSLVVQPLVGALLGILLLGDPILATTIVGGACVLACLSLSGLSRAPAPHASVDTTPGT
ncbi:MAG: EamA family transporter [Chloroflexi bacterium]|nr:EamA family transporter [Chloroflexota bacterium]MBV9546005.1 EamA family transporter [Chloroflexota bacterium]